MFRKLFPTYVLIKFNKTRHTQISEMGPDSIGSSGEEKKSKYDSAPEKISFCVKIVGESYQVEFVGSTSCDPGIDFVNVSPRFVRNRIPQWQFL